MYMHSIQIVDWKSTHNLSEPRCLPGVLLGTETRLDYLTPCRHRHKAGHSLSWKTYHVVFSSILQLTSWSAFCPETKLSLPHLRPALELVQYWIVVLWAFLVLNVSVEILCFFFVSDEANVFLKANEQRGKALETTYEQIREQDLDDLEALVKRRKQIRFSRSL